MDRSPAGTRAAARYWLEQGQLRSDADRVIEEVPVALVYNGISHVVMMATPMDLEDFALGFSLSEGILADIGQLQDLEVVTTEPGLELRMQIAAEAFAGLKERRRNLAGRTGCGLCGAESLAQVIPTPQRVTTPMTLPGAALARALAALADAQPLKALTGAAHGAAYCNTDGEILLVREDVGRHNALDKTLGAMIRGRCTRDGFMLVTSRASYEMVAKTASAGIGLLAAVSAPTSLAIEYARACELTLVAHLGSGRQVIYSGEQRLVPQVDGAQVRKEGGR
jgi:FdhD protein